MDNFRKFNGNKRTRPSSVDGFKPTSDRNVSKDTAPLVGRSKAYQPQSKMIGDFKGKEGFRPARQSTIQASAQPVDRNPARTAEAPVGLDAPLANIPDKARKRIKGRRHIIKKALKASAVLFVVLTLIGGFLFAKGYINLRKVFKGGGDGAAALQKNVDPSKLKGEGDGRVNILILGKGGLGHQGADLTDTILIVSIDPVQKQAAILSIPRDLYVQTASGGHTKINSVYALAKDKVLAGKKTSNQAQQAEDAGFQAIESTLESKIGIPIHYHVMVDFAGFKQAIDTVGGIDINVSKELAVSEHMFIDGKSYYLNVQAGQQHFDGFRALAFARTRQTSTRGDFDRSERQRAVLVALKSKVFSAGTYGNPTKISQLSSAFGNHVQTNLSINDIGRLYDIGKEIDGSKVISVGLADPPNNYVTTANIDGLSVVIPKAGIDNYKDIQNFVRNKLKDSYLAQENANIIILNGTTTTGLASRTSEELKSFGYNITKIGDAPTKTYTNTVIVDLRSGQKKYTQNYLQKRFGVTAVTSLPDSSISPGTADFVIILGTNEVSRLQQ
jgi:polyisoprenyl-teichoic acid--peptidoglycan teichoic acid transferase